MATATGITTTTLSAGVTLNEFLTASMKTSIMHHTETVAIRSGALR